MATNKERDMFVEKILGPIGANYKSSPNELVTGFLAMEGHQYNGELMVVGRAVNGWGAELHPDALSDLDISGKFADDVLESVTSKAQCPLKWVTDSWGSQNVSKNNKTYNTSRSAFWRCIGNVVQELKIADISSALWSSKLVWSNLYKVSPAGGGNPGERLCSVQEPGCRELFKLELSTYKPQQVLLLTGLNWAKPFIESICPKHTTIPNRLVQAIGKFSINAGINSKIVVAVHPQGKPGNEWVKEVVEAFES